MFTKVDRRSVADDVIEQVAGSIQSGQYGAGDKLPSEFELAESFGVGRSTVREALKVLEVLGLIRRGNDGAFVNQDYERTGLSRYLHADMLARRIDIIHLYQARRLLEVELVQLATAHLEEGDFDKLRELCQTMESTPVEKLEDYVGLDKEFHRTICTAASNPYLIQLWEVTYDMFLTLRRQIGLTREDLELSNIRHRKLVEALNDRNPNDLRMVVIESLALGEKDLVEAIEQTAE